MEITVVTLKTKVIVFRKNWHITKWNIFMYDGISKQIDIVDEFLYLESLLTTGGSFAIFRWNKNVYIFTNINMYVKRKENLFDTPVYPF